MHDHVIMMTLENSVATTTDMDEFDNVQLEAIRLAEHQRLVLRDRYGGVDQIPVYEQRDYDRFVDQLSLATTMEELGYVLYKDPFPVFPPDRKVCFDRNGL